MPDDKLFTVYVLANRLRGVLYIGVTSDLIGRIGKHRSGELGGFSAKWRLRRLVWYET